jgi:hypothetical protein
MSQSTNSLVPTVEILIGCISEIGLINSYLSSLSAASACVDGR